MARKTRKDASNPLMWIQKLVRCSDYLLSGHAREGVEDGEFSMLDIEKSIICGRIIKTENDETDEAIDGKKYVICGLAVDGLAFNTVGKLVEWIDGETYFIITAGRI